LIVISVTVIFTTALYLRAENENHIQKQIEDLLTAN